MPTLSPDVVPVHFQDLLKNCDPPLSIELILSCSAQEISSDTNIPLKVWMFI